MKVLNTSILFFIILLNCLLLVFGVEAPTVYIPNQGHMIGTYLKMFRTQNIKAYLGIRFAEAQRFAPPDIRKARWRGMYNATSFAPDCWQGKMIKDESQTNIVQNLLKKNNRIKFFDENCLNLNIFIPDGIPSSNGYAVIVWIHGGDFSSGSAYDIDPFQLVFKQNVIVVTVSYRLGIFGFLSTGDGEAQGNFGLMDQSAALFWVKSYINHFGGDPKAITIMGHSAGAISVGLHLSSGEWSRGAFNKAIMMSGHPLMEDIVRMPSKYNDMLDKLASLFGCLRRPTSVFLQCLRQIDPKVIIDNIPNVNWGPVVDIGLSNTSFPFITEYPLKSFQNANFQDVPVLIGFTDMEEPITLSDKFKPKKDKEFEQYIHEIALNDFKNAVDNDEWCTNFQIVTDTLTYMYGNEASKSEQEQSQSYLQFQTDRLLLAPLYLFLEMYSKRGTLFVYEFKIKPQTKFMNLPEMTSIPKYFDQIFVWGTPYMDQGSINSKIVWSQNDKKIADVVMTLWANFAKTSNPTKSNVYIKWSMYQSANQSVLVIDENFYLKLLSKPQIVEFWNTFYWKVIGYAADCCNVTSNGCLNSFQYTIIVCVITRFIVRQIQSID